MAFAAVWRDGMCRWCLLNLGSIPLRHSLFERRHYVRTRQSHNSILQSLFISHFARLLWIRSSSLRLLPPTTRRPRGLSWHRFLVQGTSRHPILVVSILFACLRTEFDWMFASKKMSSMDPFGCSCQAFSRRRSRCSRSFAGALNGVIKQKADGHVICHANDIASSTTPQVHHG